MASAELMKASLPPTEEARLKALISYSILDTPPEKQFDDITRLAAFIADCPMATITLVDRNRQWFKSKAGADITETPRDVSFCAHTILQRSPLVVPDATQDLRFRDNPFVTGEPSLRYYAGIPLVTQDDHALGALCVLDLSPRDLRPEQLDALRTLGRQVMTLLDLRHAVSEISIACSQLRQREGMEGAGELLLHLEDEIEKLKAALMQF